MPADHQQPTVADKILAGPTALDAVSGELHHLRADQISNTIFKAGRSKSLGELLEKFFHECWIPCYFCIKPALTNCEASR